jgi:hypothetical protein
MTTTSTAPACPSLEDWYAALGVEAPPTFRGVHRMGAACPGYGRYAIVSSAGDVLTDALVSEPLTPERHAQLQLVLEIADPLPAPRRLQILR